MEALGELAHLMDRYEEVIDEILEVDRQVQVLEKWRSVLFAATKEAGGDIFGLGDVSLASVCERAIGTRVDSSTKQLKERSANLLKVSLPYTDLETTRIELKKAQDTLQEAAEQTGKVSNSQIPPPRLTIQGPDTFLAKRTKAIDKLPRPVVKTVARVSGSAKSARGLINTGVSKLREKPLSAAASAAEYTKGAGLSPFPNQEPPWIAHTRLTLSC